MDDELKKILWCILAVNSLMVLAAVWHLAPMFTRTMTYVGFP